MNVNSTTCERLVIGIAAVATLLLAACAPFDRSAPRQVAASNPTVSYQYRDDDEPIQTSDLAETFCSQYQLAPRALGLARDRAGAKLVNFECAGASGLALSAVNPSLTYTYGGDQELLDASRRARAHCLNSGLTSETSNIRSNTDGTKTITFRCNPS